MENITYEKNGKFYKIKLKDKETLGDFLFNLMEEGDIIEKVSIIKNNSFHEISTKEILQKTFERKSIELIHSIWI